MKTIARTMTALLCFAAFNAPAFAEEKSAAPPVQPISPHQGMADMGGMSEEQMDAHLRKMQEYLLKSHDFMHQIRETKDEKEQARIKDEWLNIMKNHVKANQVPKQLERHGMPEDNAPKK